MRYLQSFICSLLLITTPITHLYSQVASPKYPTEIKSLELQIKNLHLLTYDGILNLLDEIESGELEKRCDFQELEKINQFLILLAREGSITGDLVLLDDIAELAREYDYAPPYDVDRDYVIAPAFAYHQGEVVLCGFKKKCKKAWKKTKKFVSTHKEEIIIGAVTVIAAGAIVTVGVMAGTAEENNIPATRVIAKEEPKKAPDIKQEQTLSEVNPPSILKELIQEKLEPIKELANETPDISFREKAREMGAICAHEALDSVVELVSVIPQLQQELVDLGEKLLPEGLIPEGMKHPVENFEKAMHAGHEKIDQAFSTNHSELYSPEARVAKNDGITRCELPFPGKITEITVDAKQLARAGEALDKAKFTKAGRSLMKHGYREESVYPRPVGTPEEINKHGQKILDSILKHPEKITYERQHPTLGKVVEIVVPGKGGARFTVDGEMIGFLEP